ncbi:2'-5' RNA ligase family protein [Flavisolibacter ginsenosidimutans]|uniref:2'-5' RNA ligase family protein n=1 Tax=Flavisolibacter ginsenosidimutans TaxID=661481 RepID=A0A5B8UMC5_9BACT|nr:2'-5' RNA ligase family protein [Flavisolibacter ginsenosidimutans]QEC57831.1 2'-5' RNA ligase family protein [Flavisolibacter ginsenosidimutans]
MQKQITSIPGYRVFECLLVLQPHEELRAQITAIKKEFAEKYKAPLAFHTKPQIALVSFLAYQMTQERIINRIGTIAMGVTPFKVELSGFGSFPSHTIYAAVTTKVPIQNVVKELKSATQLMTLKKDNKPHFIEESHLTICRKLKPWQFEESWLEYSHHHFSGRFIADSLILLRRPVGEIKYEAIMRFEFQNLPVATRQGSLFM